MSIEPVQERKSNLGNGVKSATIGGLIGYASKYALPLTTQEKDADYRKIVKIIKNNAQDVKKAFLESIKNIENKTLSQDIYVKIADNMAKNNVSTYNRMLKQARPTMPFIATGFGVGLLISFIKSTFSTEIS